MLLAQLPQDSKFVQVIGGDIVRWDRRDHRLADIYEALILLNHNYVQSHRKTRLPKLKPMRRPGFDDVMPGNSRTFKGQAVPLAELKAMTDRWRKGGGDGGN